MSFLFFTRQQSEFQNGEEQFLLAAGEKTSIEKEKTTKKKSSVDSDNAKNGTTKKKSKKSKKSTDSEKENISVVCINFILFKCLRTTIRVSFFSFIFFSIHNIGSFGVNLCPRNGTTRKD